MSEQVLIKGDRDERPEPYPWTTIRQWVYSAGVHHYAELIYTKLAMLAWVNQYDDSFELYTDEIAAWVGLKRGDKVKPYVDQLVAIKAIKVTQQGRGMPNIYKVYDLPPADYTGPVSVLQKLKLDRSIRKSLKKALEGQPPAETPSRGDGAAADAGDEPENPGLPAETPSRGDGDEAEMAAEAENGGLPAETPSRGDGAETPSGGDPETLSRGAISSYGFSVVNEPPPPTPPSPAAAAVDGQAVTEEGEGDSPIDFDAVVAQVLAHKPGWRPASIRAAMTQALEDGRAPAVVPAAMLAVAADPASYAPQRLLQDGPWWATTVRPAAAGAPAPRRGPRCRRHPDQLADGCRLCADEAADVDPPLAAATAASIAKRKADEGAASIKAAAARRRGVRPPQTARGVSMIAQRAGEPTSPAVAAAG